MIEEAYTLNKVLKYSVVHLKDSCASETPALDTTDIVYIFVLPLTAKIVLPLISPSHMVQYFSRLLLRASIDMAHNFKLQV